MSSLTEGSAVPKAVEKQITHEPRGHILTNIGVWSPDSQWIVYDTRSDPAGAVFDGDTIEVVNVSTGEIKVVYRATRGAHCGVATFSPVADKVVFILGPEQPTPDWQYGPYHRRGVVVDARHPGPAQNLDGRDLVPPFTPGALRGGTHLHVFSPNGQLVSFTYEDHLLAQFHQPGPDHDVNQRNVGVCLAGHPVRVKPGHSHNQSGDYFSVLVTHTTARPKPGSDEIQRACEEGWIGTNGYLHADGRRQRAALAFQGQVVAPNGQVCHEVFVVDIPDDITQPGAGPLAGTPSRLPFPPKGAAQRRITYTANRKYPGLQGPRHWLRSSPEGARIACLMKDDAGLVQIWAVSPNGGPPEQITHNAWPVASAFTWSPGGRRLAYAADGSLFVTDVAGRHSTRLTPRVPGDQAPRPEACVFSPDGRKIAYVRRVPTGAEVFNQIFVLFLPRQP